MTDHQDNASSAGTPGRQLWATTDLLMKQFLEYTELMTDASGRPLGGTDGPTNDVARGVLTSLQRLAEQAPAPAAQLDVFLSELRAKRASIGALQLQLAAFEQQLDLLEKTLLPIQEWGKQWLSIQGSLVGALPPIRPADAAGGSTSSTGV